MQNAVLRRASNAPMLACWPFGRLAIVCGVVLVSSAPSAWAQGFPTGGDGGGTVGGGPVGGGPTGGGPVGGGPVGGGPTGGGPTGDPAPTQTTGWKILIKASGTKSSSDPLKQTDGLPFDTKWTPNGEPSVNYFPSAGSYAPVGATASASTSGTVTIVCTWLGSKETLKDKITLAITSSAGFSVNYAAFDDVVPEGATGTANNGLGDKAPYLGDNGGWLSSGTHLLTKATNGQTTVSFTLTPSASGHYTPPSQFTVGPKVLVSVHVVAHEDPRSVTISRGIPAKKWNDPTLNKDRDEWVEDDGTGHGQSRWSYINNKGESSPFDSMFNPGIEDVVNTQIVVAQPSGAWSGNTSYQWSSPNTYDQKNSHREAITRGSASYWEEAACLPPLSYPGWHDKSGSGEVNVDYTLTDNGSTTPVIANAKYVFHLHDEWEKMVDNGQTSSTGSITLPLPPSTYTSNPNVPTPTPEKKEWTFFDASASQKVTLKTTFGASFKPNDWLNIGGSIETEGSLEVKSSYASTAIVYLTPGDMAWPKIDYTIRTQHKLVDHYVASGWDANTARTDGKWDQAADLALRPQDIAPGWIVTRGTGNNPNP